MPEMHLRQSEFTEFKVVKEHLVEKKKEYDNLKKQEIHDIFINTN